MSIGKDPDAYCKPPIDGTPPRITPDLVRTAFQLVRPPFPELHVEPSNGRTLVNFKTNFYTVATPQDVTVVILEQPVELHIVPAHFTWRFGDGESTQTDAPGTPYPGLAVTHEYRSKGQVQAGVDVTWTAVYRVGGGPWSPVEGTVTTASEPVSLEVVTATPTLVGY